MDSNIADTIQLFIGFGSFLSAFTVWRITSTRSKARDAELRLAEEAKRQQSARIADLERQNEMLQKQLEWHGKLLETQERVVRHLSAPSPRALPEREAAPSRELVG
jgi:hypothetical protein